MPEPDNDPDYRFSAEAEDFPEEWTEIGPGGVRRLRSDKRPLAPQRITVGATGKVEAAGKNSLLMYRRRYWGAKSVSVVTLKNHYCQKVLTFDASLASLIERQLVIDKGGSSQGGISLSLRMKAEIDSYIR